MGYTITTGLLGNVLENYVYCGGEKEAQRRARQISAGKLRSWAPGKLKSWTHIEGKAKRAAERKAAEETVFVGKPSRRVLGAVSALTAAAAMATPVLDLKKPKPPYRRRFSLGGGGR